MKTEHVSTPFVIWRWSQVISVNYNQGLPPIGQITRWNRFATNPSLVARPQVDFALPTLSDHSPSTYSISNTRMESTRAKRSCGLVGYCTIIDDDLDAFDFFDCTIALMNWDYNSLQDHTTISIEGHVFIAVLFFVGPLVWKSCLILTTMGVGIGVSGYETWWDLVTEFKLVQLTFTLAVSTAPDLHQSLFDLAFHERILGWSATTPSASAAAAPCHVCLLCCQELEFLDASCLAPHGSRHPSLADLVHSWMSTI